MRISISVTNYDGADLRAIAQAADEAGADTLWVTDHLIQADPNASPDGAMFEAYTTLGYLAAASERVRLGAMVSPVTFREPALLVKAVTTLDVLSGGRAWLGIGAGYQQDEAAALGLPLPPTAERFERLDEALRIALAMWAGDEQPIHGAHYQLTHPASYPRRPPARTRRSSSAAPVSSTPCDSWRSMATPATCSTSPTAAAPCATSWTCWRTTASGPALRGHREDDQHAARPGRGTGRLRRSLLGTRRARDRPRRGHHQRALDTSEDRHAHRRHARLGPRRRTGHRLEVDA